MSTRLDDHRIVRYHPVTVEVWAAAYGSALARASNLRFSRETARRWDGLPEAQPDGDARERRGLPKGGFASDSLAASDRWQRGSGRRRSRNPSEGGGASGRDSAFSMRFQAQRMKIIGLRRAASSSRTGLGAKFVQRVSTRSSSLHPMVRDAAKLLVLKSVRRQPSRLSWHIPFR